jgi:23S rRNA (guanosine2251-2'-O)-methyltransferase
VERITGRHPVRALLESGRAVDHVVVARGSERELRAILDQARHRGVPVRVVDRPALDRLAGGSEHQGILAMAAAFAYANRASILAGLSARPLLLVLDRVQDPHNLGALLRTAAAAGFEGVFLPERHAAGVTPGAIKASAGTAGLVPVGREVNLVALAEELKERGIWLVAVEAGGAPAWSGFDFRLPVALVLGGEESGIRPLLRRKCEAVVGLPLAPGVESLNVSVAFGAVAYEILRQRVQPQENQ